MPLSAAGTPASAARGITVQLGERSYPIRLTDSYRQLPGWLKPLGFSGEGWIISHQRILQHYGPSLLAPLRQAGWRLNTLTVPESESSKSLAMVARLARTLARHASLHIPVLFAFGGGVVGDLTGFVASVWRRGIPYVQLPTTLLAQVDSSIGGKTGVDLAQGKNLIGTFYQPRLVVNNLEVLRTLSLRQRRSGFAEVLKYGVIADPALFAFLESHLDACLELEPRAVRLMVERSCRVKARVVSHDERETGTLRTQLNFGHTVGHALEAASGYTHFTHGEAIAIGMCLAAQLGVALGLCAQTGCDRLVQLIHAAGLPTHTRAVSPCAVFAALRYDKKMLHGRPRWVLPRRIGQVVISEDVPDSLVRQVLMRTLR